MYNSQDVSTVTVEEAIAKGRKLLVWTPLAIMFGAILCTGIGIATIPNDSIWILICGFSGFFLIITLPFIFYFRVLAGWRIWAFGNVRNVHELKHMSQICRLTPKDDSFWWRFEKKTLEQKQKLEEIQDKFNLPDIFEDDLNIPFETVYNYAKVNNYVYFIMTPVYFIGAAVLLLLHQTLIGLLLLASGLVFGYTTYKRLRIKGPVLILSNDGITTNTNGFHPWRDISNEKIFYVSAGKASYYGLSYDANGEHVKLSLKELTGMRSYKVDHVLRTYRGRYESTIGNKHSFQ